MSDFVFVGGGTYGDWNDYNNWTQDGSPTIEIPHDGDNVSIGVEVTIPPALPVSLNSLTLNANANVSNVTCYNVSCFGYAVMSGTLIGNVYFYNYTSLQAGVTVIGNANFYDNTTCYENVSGSASFYGTATNVATITNGNFYETSLNAGTVTDAIFNGSSVNSGYISNSMTFFDYSVNYNPISCAVVYFYGYANNNAPITAITTLSFNGSSQNALGITLVPSACEAAFNDNAVNNGIITGTIILNGQAQNRGNVTTCKIGNSNSYGYFNSGTELVWYGPWYGTYTYFVNESDQAVTKMTFVTGGTCAGFVSCPAIVTGSAQISSGAYFSASLTIDPSSSNYSASGGILTTSVSFQCDFCQALYGQDGVLVTKIIGSGGIYIGYSSNTGAMDVELSNSAIYSGVGTLNGTLKLYGTANYVSGGLTFLELHDTVNLNATVNCNTVRCYDNSQIYGNWSAIFGEFHDNSANCAIVTGASLSFFDNSMQNGICQSCVITFYDKSSNVSFLRSCTWSVANGFVARAIGAVYDSDSNAAYPTFTLERKHNDIIGAGMF